MPAFAPPSTNRYMTDPHWCGGGYLRDDLGRRESVEPGLDKRKSEPAISMLNYL